MDSVKDLLFNNETETTYRNDYKKNKTIVTPKTKLVPKAEKPEQTSLFAPDYSPKYVETMTKWKNCISPFNLYIRPNPVRCDPRIKQKPYEKLGDPEREKVQKTRPRLVMTPATSLDDIDEPEKRSLIVDDMYVSTLNYAQQVVAELAFPVDKNVKAPLGDTFAPPKPIDLPKRRPPYVAPEWRKDSVLWDRKQMRGYTDPTQEFWLSRSTEHKKQEKH